MKTLALLYFTFYYGCLWPASASPAAVPTTVNGQEVTQAPGLLANKLFQLTAEGETSHRRLP